MKRILLLCGLVSALLTSAALAQQNSVSPAGTPAVTSDIPPGLSPAAAEVVKLAKSGVADEVVVAFIKNSQAFFNLSSNDVLALKDVGISAAVLSGMLNHDSSLRGQSSPSVAAVPQSSQAAPAATTASVPATAYVPSSAVVPSAPTVASPAPAPIVLPGPASKPTPRIVVVEQTPPAPRVEVVPVAPAPNYYWVPGYWSWRGSWIWVGGRWAVRPWHGAVWVGGHWAHHGRGYVWIGGRWH